MATIFLLVNSDVFQDRLDAVIKKVPGVTGKAEDILAKGGSEINDDTAVISLLQTAKNNILRFNPDKIQFKKREQVFLGSTHGMCISIES